MSNPTSKHAFTVKQVSKDPEPAGNYNYEIYRGSTLIARYWHDFRGDEHGITFLNGTTEERPLNQVTDFLKGGGPQPLTLSDAAAQFLDAHASVT
jgi:hypothetical protein